MKNKMLTEMRKLFRPEFLNRLDEIIVFHHLTQEEILKIVDLQIGRVNAQTSRNRLQIEVSQELKEMLAREGYAPDMGARPLRRAVQKFIEDPLSEEMLLGRFEPGDVVRVELDKSGQILFRKGEGSGGSTPPQEEQIVNN
jgi:ATP-dependent Clp protease ATP-binding subunit ClpC